MTRHRRRSSVPVPTFAFAGFRFPPEVITLAVRWYLRFGLSYQDVEEQRLNLFPHRTALENVMEAPVWVRKMSRAAAERRGLELLGQVGLADRADAYPAQLSGGQQQRVAIARALAMKLKLMLLDDPTAPSTPNW